MPHDDMDLLRIAARVAARRYAADGRYLVVDMKNKVAYPYSNSEGADGKLTELYQALDQGNKDYLSDLLNGQPPTADSMLNAEAEADVMVFSEENGEGTGICFSSSDRGSFTVPWPPEGEDFLGNGDPLVFYSANSADGEAIQGVDTSTQEDPHYQKWISEHDGEKGGPEQQ